MITTKLEENQMASFGGLRRRSKWAWRDGRVLKKERPGIRRVWMILGLQSRTSALDLSNLDTGGTFLHCDIAHLGQPCGAKGNF